MTIIELENPMSFTGVSGRWRNGSGNSMAWNLYGISADGYTQNTVASYPNISQASGNSGGMVNGMRCHQWLPFMSGRWTASAPRLMEMPLNQTMRIHGCVWLGWCDEHELSGATER